MSLGRCMHPNPLTPLSRSSPTGTISHTSRGSSGDEHTLLLLEHPFPLRTYRVRPGLIRSGSARRSGEIEERTESDGEGFVPSLHRHSCEVQTVSFDDLVVQDSHYGSVIFRSTCVKKN